MSTGPPKNLTRALRFVILCLQEALTNTMGNYYGGLNNESFGA